MVYALHEHELLPNADAARYEAEVAEAIRQIDIPGLLHAVHLRGFKGERHGRYAVLWMFESAEAIEQNFGTPEEPRWPPAWLHYENDILAKYLDRHPDTIDFTDYQVIHDFAF